MIGFCFCALDIFVSFVLWVMYARGTAPLLAANVIISWMSLICPGVGGFILPTRNATDGASAESKTVFELESWLELFDDI